MLVEHNVVLCRWSPGCIDATCGKESVAGGGLLSYVSHIMCVQCIYNGRGGDGERVELAYIVSVWKQHILCLLYGLDSRHTSNFDKSQHLTLVTF